jgi:phosphate uptake regulator
MLYLMIRKLIQISPSTSVVSLPSEWIKKNKLKKGSEINLEESENRIILSSKSRKSSKECELDVAGLDRRLIWGYVDAAYIAGYDTIVIKTNYSEHMEDFEKVTKFFPGMMIQEEKANRVVLKDIADKPEEDLNKVISRIFNMKISMIEDSIESIKKSDWQTLSTMKRRDYSINSYVSYCMRQLNKFSYDPMSKAAIFHTYVKTLEMLSDELSGFFLYVAEKKQKIDVAPLIQILDIYRKLHRLHFGFNTQYLAEINGDRHKLLKYNVKNEAAVTFLKSMSSLLYDLEELEMQFHV